MARCGRQRPGQAHQPAHRGDQPDLDLGQRELRLLLGHDQVAGQGELEAAAEGVAVERGDDRFVDRAARGESAEAGLRHPQRSAGGGVEQVVARTERTASIVARRTGDDRDPEVAVGEVGVEDVGELLAGVGGQRVAHLRSVDRDLEDVPVAAHLDELVVVAEAHRHGRQQRRHPLLAHRHLVALRQRPGEDPGAVGVLAEEQRRSALRGRRHRRRRWPGNAARRRAARPRPRGAGTPPTYCTVQVSTWPQPSASWATGWSGTASSPACSRSSWPCSPRAGRRRVDPDGVLAQRPAVGADQPEGTRGRATAQHRLDDRVQRVGVARAAEVGQPAGDGQAARVVVGQADAVGHDRDRDREAGVQVVRRHLGRPDARQVSAAPTAVTAGRGDAQVGAAHQLAVAQVAVTAQVDPLLARGCRARARSARS